ncbi:hypothetical protein [Lentibacillus cibarius]|uniref:Uncharacterized protein n=1 Tax=Lentibacillus cibarius TaxID=2583219 RepID=A0A5S3QJ31_9BACI|nr:hypothetical protein [Lentibacillus cibarius]TMN21838.1 hypothetical protein FFL34_06715 [Lentibacillus cibarius]
MNKTTIEPHYYDQIKHLSLDDFANIALDLYNDYRDDVMAYALNNLNQFNQQKVLFDDSKLFYWDISDDPYLNYLIRKHSAEIWERMITSKKSYILINLDVFNGINCWSLYLPPVLYQ